MNDGGILNKQRLTVVAVAVVAVAVVVSTMYLTSRERSQPVNAATVNGVPIAMEAYDTPVLALSTAFEYQFTADERDARMTELRKNVLESLINLEVARQAAAEAGIEIGTDQIDEVYGQIRAAWGSDEEFEQSLLQQSMTPELYRGQLESQLLIEGYFSQVAGTIVASDQEVREAYENNKSQYLDDDGALLSFEQVESRIKADLTQRKRLDAYRVAVDEFKSSAKIVVFVEEFKDLY